MLFTSNWTAKDTIVGIYLDSEARACTFMANHFMVNRRDVPKGEANPHDMKAAFAGDLESTTFMGNTYSADTPEGRIFGPADQAPELCEKIMRRIIKEP